jgi:hypothetical protein
MLIKAKAVKGYKLQSLDGEIGKVKEFYFDDHHWTIRYLVADTGNWLTGRQVLISPYALTAVNNSEQYIAVDLTKQQIEDSPSLDSDKPGIATSRCHDSSKTPTMGIMGGRIMETHICGDLIPTLYVTVQSGQNRPKVRKSGTITCAALTL